MEFITVEQFKEQPVGVQKVFLDWWETNLSEVDLIGYIGKSEAYKECFPSLGRNVAVKCFEMGIEIIPLLTEGQLRKFIEDKLEQIHYENDGRKIELDITHNNGFTRILEGVYGSAKGVKRVEWIIEDGWGKRYDLLKAYWKVACSVAKEGLNEKILC